MKTFQNGCGYKCAWLKQIFMSNSMVRTSPQLPLREGIAPAACVALAARELFTKDPPAEAPLPLLVVQSCTDGSTDLPHPTRFLVLFFLGGLVEAPIGGSSFKVSLWGNSLAIDLKKTFWFPDRLSLCVRFLGSHASSWLQGFTLHPCVL